MCIFAVFFNTVPFYFNSREIVSVGFFPDYSDGTCIRNQLSKHQVSADWFNLIEY
jgi:hypothetical protein